MNYILSRTHHNKRAKRHIIMKSSDINYLLTFANKLDKTKYDYEIYSGNWKLLYQANDEGRMYLIKDGD